MAPDPHGMPPDAPKDPGDWRLRVKLLTRKTWFFIFQVVTFSILMVAFGLWGYFQIMKQVIGNISFFNFKKAVVSIYGPPKVLLIEPRRTAEFLRPDTAIHDTTWPYRSRGDDWPFADTLWYAKEMTRRPVADIEVWRFIGSYTQKKSVLIEYWEDLLFTRAITYELADESALTNLSGNFDVVLLPSALLLSREERTALKDFLAQGGNLLMCWSTGCRWETGEWAGFDFLSQVVGGTVGETVSDPSGSSGFILRGTSPLTAMIAPGTHLDCFIYDGYVCLDVIESRTSVDAFRFAPYWKQGSTAAAMKQAIVVHGNYLKGRFVWMAFSPGAVQEQKDNLDVLKQLTSNSLDWLMGKPIIAPQVWPEGYRAGGAVVVDLDGEAEQIRQVTDRLTADGVSVDLMIDPGRLQGGTGFGNLPTTGTGLKFASGGPTDEMDAKGFHRWAEQNLSRVEQLTGKRPEVLHPSNWHPTDAILRGALKSELRVFLACDDPRFYGPRYRDMRPFGWWLLSREQPVALMAKSALSLDEWRFAAGRNGALQPTFGPFADLARIRYAGGVHIALMDAGTLVELNAVDLPGRVAMRMDSSGFYRASVKTLAERFAAAQSIRVRTTLITALRARIDLSNVGRWKFEDAVFDAWIPGQFDRVDVTAQRVGANPRNVEWDVDRGRCRFTVPKLSPGENFTLFIDMINYEDQPPAEPTEE
ncbi:MAG: hypothetical protein FJY67_04490 [Calditrichaeota bacterium]|nr:hypothetical protein [Calditrichota bacterium]